MSTTARRPTRLPAAFPLSPRSLRTLALLGLLSPLVACGSDKAPPPSAGSGGNSGVVGGASGSSDAALGGNPDSMFPPVMESGMAVAKFCNPLGTADMKDIEFTLELGTKKVTIKANTRSCTPLKGLPCVAIPAGMIPIRLLADGMPLLEGVSSGLPDGSEVLFVADLDERGALDLPYGVLKSNFKCDTVDYELISGGADGGAPPPPSDAGPLPPRTAPKLIDSSWLAPIEGGRLSPAGSNLAGGMTAPGKWRAVRP